MRLAFLAFYAFRELLTSTLVLADDNCRTGTESAGSPLVKRAIGAHHAGAPAAVTGGRHFRLHPKWWNWLAPLLNRPTLTI